MFPYFNKRHRIKLPVLSHWPMSAASMNILLQGAPASKAIT